MSYYRRGYSWEQVHYLQAPVGGWNPDMNPWEMAANQAPQLDNFLIRPGKIVTRGGFAVVNDLTAQAPLNLCGYVGSTSWIRLASKVASGTAFVDHWNVPLVRPSSSAALAKAVNPSLWVPFGSAATAAGNNPVGPRSINFDGLLYGLTYDAQLNANATAQDVNATYTVWKNQLYTIPQTAGSGTNVTTATAAPLGAFDLRAHHSRIWLLGGCDTPGGLSVHSPTTLFFSNPIVSGGGLVAADWKDPVSNLTNQIVMDRNNADFGVALATVRGGLLVLRRNSLWLLRGTTSASYTLSPVSREVGCLDARSVVECDRGVYFLSHKGLMFTDGVRVKNVSGTAYNTIRLAVGAYLNSVINGFGGYATCALVSDGQILVTLGLPAQSGGAPTGSNQPIWCGLFNPETNAWVRLTSPIWNLDGTMTVAGNDYPGWAIEVAPYQLYTIGDKYITQLENLQTAGSIIQPLKAGAGADSAAVGTMVWANPGNITAEDAAVAEATRASQSSLLPPGSGADSAAVGTAVWSNPGNITVEDAAVATASITAPGGVSHFLVSQSHGFAIPAGSTITGIKAEVKRKCTSAIFDSRVSLVRGGSADATNKADTSTQWPAALTFASYGGSGDLWGAAWTPADINNAGFGVAVSASNHGASTTEIASVDFIRITVYYDPPTGTHYLQASGFGFNVPAAATINGIVVDVKRSATATTVDSEVKLLKAGVVQATNKAAGSNWPGALGFQSYGSSSDLWGTAWTPTDINNANFGAVVAATLSTIGVADVDLVRITVYFTMPNVGGQSSFVQSQGLYDKLASGQFAAIPATWKTRLAPIIGTTTLARKWGQARRYFLDHVFAALGILASSGWKVTPVNGQGTPFSTTMFATIGPTPTTGGSVSGVQPIPQSVIQRENTDFVDEVDDVAFVIAWSDISRGTNTSSVVTELYGIGVEFQPARDRR